MSQIILFTEQFPAVLAFLKFAEFFSARCALGQLTAPNQLCIVPTLKVSRFEHIPNIRPITTARVQGESSFRIIPLDFHVNGEVGIRILIHRSHFLASILSGTILPRFKIIGMSVWPKKKH